MKWKKSNNRKKATIIKIFLFPLIAIMLVQSAVTIGTLVVRRIGGMLEAYSSGMMGRLVENRGVILQNDMNQRWVSIRDDEETITGILEEFLGSEGTTPDMFMESEELKASCII